MRILPYASPTKRKEKRRKEQMKCSFCFRLHYNICHTPMSRLNPLKIKRKFRHIVINVKFKHKIGKMSCDIRHF